MTNLRVLLVLCLGLAAGNAMAQGGAAPSPAASSAAAPASCVKPGHYPGKKASDTRKEAWMNEMRAWGDCVKVQVADLRAQIDAKMKLANSSIEEYNAGLKVLQEEQREAESPDPGAKSSAK